MVLQLVLTPPVRYRPRRRRLEPLGCSACAVGVGEDPEVVQRAVAVSPRGIPAEHNQPSIDEPVASGYAQLNLGAVDDSIDATTEWEAAETTDETPSQEQLNAVMQAARDRIRPCVQSALRRTADLTDITMTMVVNGEGELEELAVEPQDDILGSCLTLSLAESTFPSSDLERQRVEYTIRIEH